MSSNTFVFAIYDAVSGVPLTGQAGTLTFDAYKNETGANLTHPTIVEVGGGLYAFEPVPVDGHVIAFILNTAGANPPRISGYVRPEDFTGGGMSSPKIIVFAVYDPATGVPIGGIAGACSFTSYTDEGGHALAHPSIVEIGGGLYYFTPVIPLGREVCYVLTTSSLQPERYSGTIRIEDFQRADSSTLPTPIPNRVAFPSATDAATASVYGTDLVFQGAIVTDGTGDYTTVTGIQNLKNSILRRLYTRKGEYKLRPDYGVGLPSYLKRKMTPSVLDQLRHDIKANISRDRRVSSVDEITLTPFTADNGTQCLNVKISIKAFGQAVAFAPPTFTETSAPRLAA